MEAIKMAMEKEQKEIQNHLNAIGKNAEVIKFIFQHIQSIYFGINPLIDVEKHPLIVLEDFRLELQNILREYENLEEEKKYVSYYYIGSCIFPR